MNDNQEKNNSFEENGSEPVTRKIAKFSAFIYLGLAITVVIVATVGIFSVSYDYEASVSPVSLPEVEIGSDVSLPEFSVPVPVLPESSASTPVINDESDVDADVSMPDEDETVALFFNPVFGEISKNYSMDKLVFSETMGDYRVHSGIDISAELGSTVVCFTDGVVSSVTDDYFYGTTVAVTHADGMVSYYMNLDPLLADNVAVGNELKAGDRIGNLGKTARCENAEPSHLHFELRINDELVDPVGYLPETDDFYE